MGRTDGLKYRRRGRRELPSYLGSGGVCPYNGGKGKREGYFTWAWLQGEDGGPVEKGGGIDRLPLLPKDPDLNTVRASCEK